MAPSKSPERKEFDVMDLIARFSSEDFPPDIYANLAQFLISNYELIIDFYKISPGVGNKKPGVKPVQRLILPLNIAKGMATGLANAIAKFEEDNEPLQNLRSESADDRIKIWETQQADTSQ